MEVYHLTVHKIEGIKETTSSYLYLYLGQNILRVLNLEFLDINPTPVPKGTLKFVIEDSQSIPQASLTFDSSIFKRPGYHWLPLFASDSKTLTAVPEEVALPRILIDIQAHILTPVQELTEDSETIEETLNDLNGNDLEKEIRRSIGLEILEVDQKSGEEKNRVLKEELFELKEKLEESNRIIEKLNEVVEQKVILCRRLENELAEKEMSQKKLEGYIEGVNGEWERKVKQLIFQLGEKENELFCLKMKNQKLSICAGGCLGVSQGVMKSRVDQDYEKLLIKLYEVEPKFYSSSLKPLEDIDKKVQQYLISKNLEGLATVSHEVNYTIFNKKIPIFLKNDALFTKYDGSVKKLDYFFSIHKSPKKKGKAKLPQNYSHLRLQTLENFEHASTSHSFLPRNKSISNRSITPVRKKILSPTIKFKL